MTNSDYKSFESLEDFAMYAESLLQGLERYLNFFVSAELTTNSIRTLPLEDVTEKAERWRAKTVPNELFINHGKYIGDGLLHIIDELKNRPSSNRALYSLISQKDITGSGDIPIPSFMIFQCTANNNILYCTAYFRALEISNFFRINLEEMRLNIVEILNSISASKVRLSVFAFNAYSKPEQLPLERTALDSMSALSMSRLYTKDGAAAINKLLLDKAQITTVIDIHGFQEMKEWLDPSQIDASMDSLNIAVINTGLDNAIMLAKNLIGIRQKNSHDPQIDQLSLEYVNAVKKIAREFN